MNIIECIKSSVVFLEYPLVFSTAIIFRYLRNIASLLQIPVNSSANDDHFLKDTVGILVPVIG